MKTRQGLSTEVKREFVIYKDSCEKKYYFQGMMYHLLI